MNKTFKDTTTTVTLPRHSKPSKAKRGAANSSSSSLRATLSSNHPLIYFLVLLVFLNIVHYYERSLLEGVPFFDIAATNVWNTYYCSDDRLCSVFSGDDDDY